MPKKYTVESASNRRLKSLRQAMKAFRQLGGPDAASIWRRTKRFQTQEC
jgi:hypothetical protein